mmetsp:Transcript_79504/g.140311  ORF Transcript_79504/g.140311 Transcript_79504/m.140311 type:complete len:207 (+) Transcript_79504:296-916(+)
MGALIGFQDSTTELVARFWSRMSCGFSRTGPLGWYRRRPCGFCSSKLCTSRSHTVCSSVRTPTRTWWYWVFTTSRSWYSRFQRFFRCPSSYRIRNCRRTFRHWPWKSARSRSTAGRPCSSRPTRHRIRNFCASSFSRATIFCRASASTAAMAKKTSFSRRRAVSLSNRMRAMLSHESDCSSSCARARPSATTWKATLRASCASCRT